MRTLTLSIGERVVTVVARRTADDHMVVDLPDGRRIVGSATRDGQGTWVTHAGRTVVVRPVVKAAKHDHAHAGSLEAPMPGKVVKVLVQVGDVVEKGQVLMTVEAMKMEHALKSPRAARVTGVRAAAGEQVVPGMALVQLEDV